MSRFINTLFNPLNKTPIKIIYTVEITGSYKSPYKNGIKNGIKKLITITRIRTINKVWLKILFPYEINTFKLFIFEATG